MHFSGYAETVRYLYDSLPMYQRIGVAAYRKDLHNTLRLCEGLGDPHRTFRSVHVAGTNGKGSSSHMIASVLQEAGFSVGLYTSPHLKSFTERIRVGGHEIEREAVVDFVNRVWPLLEEVKPSFFETTVAMAFDYFRVRQVDVAVIEVGLGGRLDSTNVITPEVSLITNIGWDHMDILGSTLSEIAMEKAGIIKKGVPVVISERQPQVERVFADKASEDGSPLHFASDRFMVSQHEDLTFSVSDRGRPVFTRLSLPLKGAYQCHNVGGVMQTLEVLNARRISFSREAVHTGLEKVVVNTGLKGRWQILGHNPLVICDTAHNPDGIREVVRQLGLTPGGRRHMVLGVVKDKDVGAVLRLLPTDANYYFCQAKVPRALPAVELAQVARGLGLQGDSYNSVSKAVQAARSAAGRNDIVFIGGSTFVVAEVEGL
jgi:dihydrofolate synthase/folylpolyglutamate synthase